MGDTVFGSAMRSIADGIANSLNNQELARQKAVAQQQAIEQFNKQEAIRNTYEMQKQAAEFNRQKGLLDYKAQLEAPNYYIPDEKGQPIVDDESPTGIKMMEGRSISPAGKLLPMVAPVKTTTSQQAELSDKEANEAASQIKSGALPPAVVQKYYSIRTGSGVKNTIKINKALGMDDFNLGEYEARWNYTNRPQTKNFLANIDAAQQNIELFRNINNAFKRGGIQAVNSAMNTAGRQFGGKTANDYFVAKKLLADDISTTLGNIGVASTDNRLKLIDEALNPKATYEQMESTLNLTSDFIKNRKASIDTQGLPGLFNKKQVVDKLASPADKVGDGKYSIGQEISSGDKKYKIVGYNSATQKWQRVEVK